MKYPGVILRGRKSRGEVLSIALANDGQHQDTGAKWYMLPMKPVAMLSQNRFPLEMGANIQRFGSNAKALEVMQK